ncbi:PREDICTED: uncharacterized transmembrane protein DDB_G0281039 [Prunus mume]|uniref:Uncharacterized transmembrane protein DDB_G0281039 n=1 Tax=Prunus mume TaxID=102107 RepID=A0ABM0NBP0_PRUMU|nr:PREDICTED: uncharacterized transmembrane protein DDB_G0281039 [Prunus mume]
MTAPNMATIAASLERSLQNCSLNHHHHHQQQQQQQQQSSSCIFTGGEGQGSSVTRQGRSSSSTSSTSDDIAHQNQLLPNYSNDATLELNSHVSLPYHWEQCLDLKTGEIYYINWRNGMKAKEDPRARTEYSGEYYSEDENSSYDSEESSTESSPSLCRQRYQLQQIENINNNEHNNINNNNNNNVLVVAGCKACLMYFMVPKQLEDCPKCSGQLLHFDRSENGSP